VGIGGSYMYDVAGRVAAHPTQKTVLKFIREHGR
jgi:hypothetical protein